MATKIGRPAVPALVRFMDKISIGHESGCVIWTAGTTPKGYGVFTDEHGKSVLAHRWLYQRLRGSIPEGLGLDHDPCDTPACVWPGHLKPTNQRANNRRGRAPTMVAYRAGTCLSGRHDMTNPANVYVKKGGDRQCKPCHREREQARNEKG